MENTFLASIQLILITECGAAISINNSQIEVKSSRSDLTIRDKKEN